MSLCVLTLKEAQIVCQSRIENSKAQAVVKIQSMPNLVSIFGENFMRI